MEVQKKFFLLDAYALIYRAYYAFIARPFKNTKGFNTSTIFGFVNTLEEILRNQSPTHIAVAFDPEGGSFRNKIFPDYKANREDTPENIRESVPIIKEILEAYNISMFEVSGYEADDVIGTISKIAENRGYEVYMMTPDKDFSQLVSDKVFMYKPKKSGNEAEILGRKEICDDFEISSPSQVIDILALWGDASDNVPGVPGIGEKTAKNLISKYGNLENVYSNIHEIKGKLKENLQAYKNQAFLSRELVTINVSVPLNFIEKDIQYSEPDRNKLLNIFRELEFKTQIQKYSESNEKLINKQKIPQQGSLFEFNDSNISIKSEYSNINTLEKDYKIINNEHDINNVLDLIYNTGQFCFDTETTSVNPNEAELVGISFSVEPHKAFYLPVSPDKRTDQKKLGQLKEVMQNNKIRKIGQNLKFDIRVLKTYNIHVEGELFDTMIAHYLLEPEQKHNLNDLSEKYLSYSPVRIEELIGEKGKLQGNMRNIPVEKIKDYACEDADVTWQLYEILSRQLDIHNLSELSESLEMPLIYVLADMESTGVALNVQSLKDYSEVLLKEIIISEKNIFKMAGVEFNISSPKQLGDILFKTLKITADAKLTKTKQFSTDEETLSKLADKHEIISEVLNYRSLRKIQNTYVEALPKLISSKTGRLHTSYNQTVTATGRLSSNNPNLQNIPVREERGREIRKAFVHSGNENIMYSADYSQIELRLMAHMSNDKNMIDAFMREEDIHTATASKIYNVPIHEVSREMRAQAKTANFGIIYGISSFGLAQRLNLNRTNAKNLIEGYFQSYPGVKAYMDNCISKARNTGYVQTLKGRKRILNDILSRNSIVRGVAERNAINTPIQGSAADIIKIAMINIFEEFKRNNLKSKMILQVHDELVFDVLKSEIKQVEEIVKNKMESAISLKVPLIIDSGKGNNWLEAH